ncbi:MAG: ABC transporter ATP-binding protein [Promethearchaeota archaeon]
MPFISAIILKLIDLTKKYGNHKAVSNINLEIQENEIIGLIGPNGAGKTTVIKMIASITRPSSGRILLRNRSGNLQNIFKRTGNLIPQGFMIDIPSFYKLTPYQILKYYAKVNHFPKKNIERRIDELLQRFNLFEWKYTNTKKFSKGMLQKLGLIQAVIHDPEIIFLDEPQTGIDPKARIDIRHFIRELQTQYKTIFVASHLLHEISELCDRIALIDHGEIVGFDTIDNLERELEISELICKLLYPIPKNQINKVLEKLNKITKPYLESSMKSNAFHNLIQYDSNKQMLKIRYNGEEKTRSDILDILVTKFKSDFTLSSFSQSKTSQLEHLYTELIGKKDSKDNKTEEENEKNA